MSIVAFIPARGGSKGVLKKNIKDINGKPLIAWSIEHALESEKIDRVIVSTDCEEIASIARKYGAEVPFIRPSEISGDLATTEAAMLHCCSYLQDRNELPEIFILIQATSPIRKKMVFDQALDFMNVGGYDSVLSVCKSHRFTWKTPASPEASYNYLARPRRQDITEVNQEYLETGSFYISKTEMLMQNKNRLFGKIGMFETSEVESAEIDSLVDFTIVSTLLKSQLDEEISK